MFSNLYIQWRDFQKASLLNENVNIKGIKDQDIPFYYFEYMLRVPAKRKYTVHISTELLKNPLYQMYKTTIDNIIYKASSGESLTPYLSRGIKNISKTDKMLNDWGFLHFHLTDIIENDGFVKRTKELLFAYREPNKSDTIYILDVCLHGDWSEKKTVEILHNNWREVLDKYRIKDSLGLAHNYSSEDIGQLRNANINSTIQMNDGTSYISIGGGLSMLGTSTLSTGNYSQMLRFFENLEQDIVQNFNLNNSQLYFKVFQGNAYVFIDSLVAPNKFIPIQVPIISNINFP